MSSDDPLYERDPEAWNAHLAEGNAKQARKRVSADVILRDAHGRILLVDPKYGQLADLDLLSSGNLPSLSSSCMTWLHFRSRVDNLCGYRLHGGMSRHGQ